VNSFFTLKVVIQDLTNDDLRSRRPEDTHQISRQRLPTVQRKILVSSDKTAGFICRSKAKLKARDVSRPDFYKKKKRRAGGFFLLFIISRFMLSLHIITFPQGYVGALRSNINKTKHQILINTSLFNFDTHKRLTMKSYIILVCTQQQ